MIASAVEAKVQAKAPFANVAAGVRQAATAIRAFAKFPVHLTDRDEPFGRGVDQSIDCFIKVTIGDVVAGTDDHRGHFQLNRAFVIGRFGYGCNIADHGRRQLLADLKKEIGEVGCLREHRIKVGRFEQGKRARLERGAIVVLACGNDRNRDAFVAAEACATSRIGFNPSA